MQDLLLLLDPWLIAPYRLPESAVAGFCLGTALLCLYCVLLGDAAYLGVLALNRRRMAAFKAEMERQNELAETALKLGDKESYKAVNKQALDAFGHSFSLGAAVFTSSLLPLPFALAWMNLRFAAAAPELPFALPLAGREPGYLFYFLILYIPVRLVYARTMHRLGPYRRLKAALHGAKAQD
ncbi:MAG: hypothetical protein AB1916_12230 [Thermodesulfobacteriota bacterium]